ncbi:MAG TPA: S8 family serine peptidase [Gemmatimonadales bacterium]
MNRRTVVLVATATLLGGCMRENEPTAPASQVPDAAVPTGAIPNRYIITLRPGSRDIQSEATRMSKDHRGRVTAVYESALRGFAVEMQPSDVAQLRKDPEVAAVEPDQVVSISGTQSPAPSWGLDRIDQRNLPLSHSYTVGPNGSGVHVYIIDTGILRTHVDFGGRAVFGFDAIQDGNGMTDCHGHGTHVAGTVGGSTYGVAKAVRLHAVRVLDCTGSGLISQVIAGINWVTAHRIKPAVANMSLGGGFSQALNTAVANSIKAGVSYAIAGGNSNLDACTVSPASTPAAITVAASDSNDQRASFSNLGTCVDIFGPGVAITSDWNASNTATMVLSGTSMATPHVAGVIALYLQTHPTATPANVRYAIASTATAGLIGNAGIGTPNLLLFTGLFGTTPGNLPPLARFDFTCTTLGCDFDARTSQDDQGVVSQSWAFGDGTNGSGLQPHHNYAAGGSFTARLTVQDAAGLTSSLTKTFTLPAAGGRAGNPPVANFTAFPNGGTVDYDASSSTDDVGIGSYKWDFGDGKSGSGKLVTHVYSAPNQFYTVTLTVFDLAGQSSRKSFQVFPNSH